MVNYKNIQDLQNIHKGQDIWILMAGSSMNYIDTSFFEGKITIGQNQMYKHFPTSYVVMKDCMEEPRFPRSIQECKELDIPLIFSEYYKGHPKEGHNLPIYNGAYVFTHNPRTLSLEDELKKLEEHQIVVSRSTATSLLHIAAYMGAKNIILAGHDAGTLNGDLYFDGYVEKDWTSSGNWSGINSWMSSLENESQIVRAYLRETYNCNIHSLNPFLNLGLEGNLFVKS
jgi:hypothetical protein